MAATTSTARTVEVVERELAEAKTKLEKAETELEVAKAKLKDATPGVERETDPQKKAEAEKREAVARADRDAALQNRRDCLDYWTGCEAAVKRLTDELADLRKGGCYRP